MVLPNPPSQSCLARPCCRHAPCPTQCIHSRCGWEERHVTFLMCLPTFAPQKSVNLWRLLYFNIITSELTCVSGMIQRGAASPEGWSRRGAAGPATQELGVAGPGLTSFYPSAAKSFFISSVAEGI